MVFGQVHCKHSHGSLLKGREGVVFNRTMSETLLAKGAFFELCETRARGDIIRLEKLPGRRGDCSSAAAPE